MKRRHSWIAAAAGVCLLSGLVALAQNKPPQDKPPQDKPTQDKPPLQEAERKVTEAEVPKAALEGLKKLAGSAAFTEFSEEIEHGGKFYEGSWKGPNGNIDALVTESGDVMEIEERIPAEMAPAGVKAAAEKSAGKDVPTSFEKKTLLLYEIHFKKDGKGHEMIFTADGRRFYEAGSMTPPAKAEKHEDPDEDEDD